MPRKERKRSAVRAQDAVSRAQRFRIYPTAEQAEQLERSISAARAFYNEGVRHHYEAWKWRSPYESKFSMAGAVTIANKSGLTFPHRGEQIPYSSVAAAMLHGALDELHNAYTLFFEKRKRGERASRPGFRSARKGPWSVRYQVQDGSGPKPIGKLLQPADTKRWAWMHVPKVGLVKVRRHRELPDDALVGFAIVKRNARNEWFAILQYEATPEPREATGEWVGIDRGVVHQVVTSDGEWMDAPSESTGRRTRRLRLRRALARKRRNNPCPADTWVTANGRSKLKRGQCTCSPGGCWKTSRRYLDTKLHLSRLDDRLVNARDDAAHKISRVLADRYDTVVMEDLSTRSMMASAAGTEQEPGTNVAQKRGLNRAIAEQGWYRLEQNVAYKANLIKVPAHHTSQTCPSCGYVDAENRQTQADFVCVRCGTQGNADVVAASNILNSGRVARDVKTDEGVNLVPAGAQSVAARGAHRESPGDETRTIINHPCERSYGDSNPGERSHAGQEASRDDYTLRGQVVSDTWGVSARRSERNPRSRHLNATSRRDGQRSR